MACDILSSSYGSLQLTILQISPWSSKPFVREPHSKQVLSVHVFFKYTRSCIVTNH
jgi:hypothetical protein